jgi:4-hydroxyproline epimerase
MSLPTQLSVIDSHTGGEPTRTVVAGGPDLGGGDMAARRAILAEQYDWLRTSLVGEPRGCDVIVGALICPPVDPTCAAGVNFFNNVGYLNMCGHGTIGVMATLAHLGRIAPGEHRLETPVGVVTATLHDANRVSFDNVSSYRYRAGVLVETPGIGRVIGDIAWGGNWFFLIAEHGQTLELANVETLTAYARAVRRALDEQQITGADGGLIDHIELFGPPSSPEAVDSRSFVYCPGGAYDRSPCGTGVSAKLACLAADEKLSPGELWRQESIIGSIFQGIYREEGQQIIPTITGTAYITAETKVIYDPHDPFAAGIGS